MSDPCVFHVPSHIQYPSIIDLFRARPGMSFGKCMILCGGPDWPTSVLAGILRLSLVQCTIGGRNPVAYAVALEWFAGKQDTPWHPYIYIFHGKIHGFRLRFSLKPIHWLTVRFYHNSSSRLKLELPYPRITLVADLQELCRSSFHWFHWRWPGASTCAEMRARCL